MPRAKIVRNIQKTRSRVYLEKAEQFCAAATTAFGASQYDAALLCAVHAGISAADAVTVALSGRRSADPDHARAIDLLRDVARDSPLLSQRADQLRALLAQKNRVEYEDRRAATADAQTAAERCQRIITWARDELRRAGFAPSS